MLGLLLKAGGLPRAPLLLGFVLAPGMEAGLVRAGMIHGWEALLRPGVLVITALGAAAVAVSLIGLARRRSTSTGLTAHPPVKGLPLPLLTLGLIALIAMFGLPGAPTSARVLPAGAGAIALAAACLLALRLVRSDPASRQAEAPFDWRLLGMLAVMLAAVALAGAPLAAAGFVSVALFLYSRVSLVAAMTTGVLAGAAVFGLEGLMP